MSLRDAVKSVDIGVCAVAECLGETSVVIHGEGGGLSVHRLLESITKSVVGVLDGGRLTNDGFQAMIYFRTWLQSISNLSVQKFSPAKP